jgi:predicted heme/steroid binding protein
MKEIKINRFTAWILFLSILLYFISGYGMTKGIVDSQLSSSLHGKILPLITFTAFVIHASLSIKYAFMRWRIWNNVSKYILFSFFVVLYLIFLYISFFYQKPIFKSGANIQQEENVTNHKAQRIFSVSELAKYDGKNGNPAYAAVDGIAYDLSSVFVDGVHFGHSAGQDLTDEFYSKHNKSILAKYPIVGVLK